LARRVQQMDSTRNLSAVDRSDQSRNQLVTRDNSLIHPRAGGLDSHTSAGVGASFSALRNVDAENRA